jgi:hypothetical protein
MRGPNSTKGNGSGSTQPNTWDLAAGKSRRTGRRFATAAAIAGLAVAAFGFLSCAGAPNPPSPRSIASESPAATQPPSTSPNTSPSDGPTVSPSETATPTTGPEVTHTPDALQTELTKWVSEKGDTGIPTSKEWEQYGKKQGLNLDDSSRESTKSPNIFSPEYCTLGMGTVVLPDENGVPHLAIPILQVDGAGNHYYLFINDGPMDATELNGVGLIPNRNNIGVVPEQHNITTIQLQTMLNHLVGDIFLVGFYLDDSSPNQSLTVQEYMSAKAIDRELANFGLEAGTPRVDYHTLLGRYPNIAKLLNAYPAQIDAKSMPFPSTFETASLPL